MITPNEGSCDSWSYYTLKSGYSSIQCGSSCDQSECCNQRNVPLLLLFLNFFFPFVVLHLFVMLKLILFYFESVEVIRAPVGIINMPQIQPLAQEVRAVHPNVATLVLFFVLVFSLLIESKKN